MGTVEICFDLVSMNVIRGRGERRSRVRDKMRTSFFLLFFFFLFSLLDALTLARIKSAIVAAGFD